MSSILLKRQHHMTRCRTAITWSIGSSGVHVRRSSWNELSLSNSSSRILRISTNTSKLIASGSSVWSTPIRRRFFLLLSESTKRIASSNLKPSSFRCLSGRIGPFQSVLTLSLRIFSNNVLWKLNVYNSKSNLGVKYSGLFKIFKCSIFLFIQL